MPYLICRESTRGFLRPFAFEMQPIMIVREYSMNVDLRCIQCVEDRYIHVKQICLVKHGLTQTVWFITRYLQGVGEDFAVISYS